MMELNSYSQAIQLAKDKSQGYLKNHAYSQGLRIIRVAYIAPDSGSGRINMSQLLHINNITFEN